MVFPAPPRRRLHSAGSPANHDGKLTRDEAQAGMPDVYTHFDEIDRKKKGYVTKKQIGQW